MRSTPLLKSVLAAALGCMALSGCGTQNAADQVPAGTTVSATTPAATPPGGDDPEMRFLALLGRVMQDCAPEAPKDKGGDGVPAPEDLPGFESAPTPRYGPGETPPGVPNADGDIPVPLPSDAAAPPESAPSPAKPASLEEVPLNPAEKCSGDKHAQRVGEAFKNTGTTGYEAMHKKLTGLDYPAARIHRMPDRAGAPRARVDLRMMGGHQVLEVTGTAGGVTVEVFGAPETEDVNVAAVKRSSTPDAPTS
ncbi:hypothetical protein [Streptomyces sp. NPDC046712]|uniref:hypothetical protein n=1 Tax=Streptomyces sp. NPDC046712 TaxID=3154802 RepID=UPI0033E89492